MSTKTDSKAQIEALLQQAKTIVQGAEDAGRDVTPAELEQLNSLAEQAGDAKNAAARAAKSQNALRSIEEAVTADAAKAINGEALDGAREGLSPQRRKTAADRFLKSDEFADFMRQHAIDGEIPKSAKGLVSRAVRLGGLKALLTGADHDESAGIFVPKHNLGYLAPNLAPLVLRDVITVGTTESDTIEYVQQRREGEGTGAQKRTVNAAAGVPEATDDEGTSGTKPKSSLAFFKKTANVETIAHWLPITKRALSDASQIRTIIDQFLSRGIDERVEEYLLDGDSSIDGQWDGLLKTTGLQQQDFDRNILRSIRKGITRVQRYGSPTAVLVSPGNNERLDLLQDEAGRFFGAGPWSQGPQTVWSLPRVVVRDLSDDQVIVGDTRTAVLWDREQTTISVSDSHADFFVRNLLAILGEARAGFGVLDPSLLAVVDVDGEDDLSPVRPGAGE